MPKKLLQSANVSRSYSKKWHVLLKQGVCHPIH